MAQSLQWIPDSLYNYSIAAVASNYEAYKKELQLFNGGIIFDAWYTLYKEGTFSILSKDMANLDLFGKVLKDIYDKRNLLHNCFQTLMDYGYEMAKILSEAYIDKCRYASRNKSQDELIKLGLSLGLFLTEAGWLHNSEILHYSCLLLCKETYSCSEKSASLLLECYKRLVQVRTLYCKFDEGQSTISEAIDYIDTIKMKGYKVSLAGIYSEFSFFSFVQSDNDQAYVWASEAISELNSSAIPRDVVNILRIASKACVSKRKFKQAELLTKQAVCLARECFGEKSLILADALIDYGLYLLHIDSTCHSVTVNQKAFDIRASILGGKNLMLAEAHENLAYASYVHEYSSGRFKDACDHIEKALDIKQSLLEADSFLLPSAKRIKALILEEIAIDSHDKDMQERLFFEAEELHKAALYTTQKKLGELNVQTSKHYGNLGRLYQSMRRFKEAECLLLKAIGIKKRILGPDDFELAISMGHLASLYNYDLELFEKAEQLYIGAINIGLKQFGEGYSGLEYDYRGLLRVYSSLGDDVKVAQLHSDIHDWKVRRDQTEDAESKVSPLDLQLTLLQPEKIFQTFQDFK